MIPRQELQESLWIASEVRELCVCCILLMKPSPESRDEDIECTLQKQEVSKGHVVSFKLPQNHCLVGSALKGEFLSDSEGRELSDESWLHELKLKFKKKKEIPRLTKLNFQFINLPKLRNVK